MSRRPAFQQAVAGTPGLTESSRKKAAAYLDGFFKSIETPEAVEKNLIKKCRA